MFYTPNLPQSPTADQIERAITEILYHEAHGLRQFEISKRLKIYEHNNWSTFAILRGLVDRGVIIMVKKEVPTTSKNARNATKVVTRYLHPRHNPTVTLPGFIQRMPIRQQLEQHFNRPAIERPVIDAVVVSVVEPRIRKRDRIARLIRRLFG